MRRAVRSGLNRPEPHHCDLDLVFPQAGELSVYAGSQGAAGSNPVVPTLSSRHCRPDTVVPTLSSRHCRPDTANKGGTRSSGAALVAFTSRNDAGLVSDTL